MLNFLSILLIIFIVLFLLIFKRKYFINAINKKTLYTSKELKSEKKTNNSSSINKTFSYQDNARKNTEFYKRTLRAKMLKFFEGNTEDKLKGLNIAKELADKSTLPILRRGLKDMDPVIVEISADLIRKFK